MKPFLIAAVTWPLLCGSPALAQVGTVTTTPGSLSVTSPLGMGPGAPVGAAGIPLGATELATPGLSPTAAGTSALGSMTAAQACSGIGASAQSMSSSPGTSMAGISGMAAGTSAPTPLFDGAGLSGNASAACTGSTAAASSLTTSSSGIGSGSTVARVGIPLGSTELGTGGLSPLPDIVTQSQSPVVPTATSAAPCPTTGMSSTMGTAMSSTSC